MRLVIVESPYAASTPEGIERNVAYARACLADSIAHGEAPFASHLLYTQPRVLRDEIPSERAKGIEAGLAWARCAAASAVYVDLGVSGGMVYGIDDAHGHGRAVEIRRLSREQLEHAIGPSEAARAIEKRALIDAALANLHQRNARPAQWCQTCGGDPLNLCIVCGGASAR